MRLGYVNNFHVVDVRQFPRRGVEDEHVPVALEAVGNEVQGAKQLCYRQALYPAF